MLNECLENIVVKTRSSEDKVLIQLGLRFPLLEEGRKGCLKQEYDMTSEIQVRVRTSSASHHSLPTLDCSRLGGPLPTLIPPHKI